MRLKSIAQPRFDFDPPSLKITQAFYEKYNWISEILDANPKVLDAVDKDFKDLNDEVEEESPGRSRYASDTVLRLCVCQVVEGRSLRETIVRVDS